MTDEPTVADVRRAYPDWTVYQGTDLRWRARNPELGLCDPMSFLQGSANAPVQSAAGAEIATG
jgi:hypothetical protein